MEAASNSNIHGYINLLASGRYGCDFKNVICNLGLLVSILRSYDNALRWMPQELLVQVMSWCHQASGMYATRMSKRQEKMNLKF